MFFWLLSFFHTFRFQKAEQFSSNHRPFGAHCRYRRVNMALQRDRLNDFANTPWAREWVFRRNRHYAVLKFDEMVAEAEFVGSRGRYSLCYALRWR